MDEDFLRNHFISNAGDLLDNLENELLDINITSNIEKKVQEVFRIMHTLKGSAGMFGFKRIAEITHLYENIYDQIRDQKLELSDHIIGLTLKVLDLLRLCLSTNENLSDTDLKNYTQLTSKAEEITGLKIEEDKALTDKTSQVEKVLDSSVKIYFLHFKPNNDIFGRGINPHDVFEEIAGFASYFSVPEINLNEEFDQTDKENFTLRWDIFIKLTKPQPDLTDVFLFYEEEEYKIFELNIENLSENVDFVDYYKKHHDNLYDKNHLKKKILEQFGEEIKPLPEETIEEEKKLLQGTLKASYLSKEAAITNIKVPSNKLDELINLVSELVITNSQLSYLSQEINNLSLKKAIANVEKLSKNLRDNALELRLVPLKSITLKFQRLVRDLSGQLGKNVELVTVGTDTELDADIINNLEGPLMHLIRNSLDHGIEMPEERVKKGKQENGIIRLVSFYSGANVFIQIQDDGKGIDPEVIRKKAIDKGLITAQNKLTNKELYELIFIPGFSTAQNLSEVSGRGVGMDVVKSNITELRGVIEIDSEVGLGTSFSLKLPLTLSIIDTLLIMSDSKPYLVPLSSIDSCHKLKHTEITGLNSKHLDYNGALVPYIYLRDFFGVTSEAPAIENSILIRHGEKSYAIIVDKVLGEHQAVIKPLGHKHKHQEYFTGASVLGDGSLALILDTYKLVSSAKEEKLTA